MAWQYSVGYHYEVMRRLDEVTLSPPGQTARTFPYTHDTTPHPPIWETESVTLYVYDGWRMILELDALDEDAPRRSHYWGLDLSGTLDGAAGIGGLLATVDHDTPITYFVLCDGHGNVTQLVDAGDGSEAAEFEYDPYGNRLDTRTDAPLPFGFSTKFLDPETGLYYYGFRWYQAEWGRWLSRDPIADIGWFVTTLSQDAAIALPAPPEFSRLYQYALNNPVGTWDYLGLTSIGEILLAFFWPWDRGPGLWVMREGDTYTQIVRGWAPVQQNVAMLKLAVAMNPQDWKQNHLTSPDWIPTMSYAPDPKNGWDVLVISPPGTDPATAKRHFIIFVLTGYASPQLHTSAIGSFRIIATADEVDLMQCRVKLNVWMYNEMSKRSFGRFANHPLFSWRPMRSQFMWWNWKEEFGFDAEGNVEPLPGNGGGW